jgi:hypothetical protein
MEASLLQTRRSRKKFLRLQKGMKRNYVRRRKREEGHSS